MLKSLEQFVTLAKKNGKKRIAVAAAEDLYTLDALKHLVQAELGTPVLVGDKEKITKLADLLEFDISEYEIFHQPDLALSCAKAVALVKEGKADLLMRGLVDSAIYLRAILHKETGLRGSGLISQIAFLESPRYHKLMAFTDSGINISPTLAQKKMMIQQSVTVFHQLGIKNPKVAVIAATENVKEAIPATTDAAMLSMMNRRNEIAECVVDGPLSIDLAFSKSSCWHKQLESEVGGDADLVLFPDINSANAFYKTMTLFGETSGASLILGTCAPVVFPSRSDTSETKFYAMACAIAVCPTGRSA
ncbi:phosphate acyltransferase [Scandinavium goeteborgense]|uniref:phosphate acyltransferase n=1 Tax=Scandinavium goeteborgense TaxID=1851514 RepID=UPI000F68C122|nr:phosphate acyltransferase [Scandinavium goeteborgense]QKN79835.1 phosphate acetytransferase [Scandinavium goeteborgense]